MNRFWIIVFSVFASGIVNGQIFHSPAKSVYLTGGAYSGQFTDPLSFTGNPAVLGSAKSFRMALSTERRWMLKDLDFSRLACSFSAGQGGMGFLFHYTGNSDYQETAMAMSYGKNLGRISLGIQFRYDQDRIPGYTTHSDGSAMLGILFHPAEKIYAGLAFSTSLFANKADIDPEKYAGNYDMGLGYEVSPMVFLSVQLEKEAGLPMNLTGCLDYRWTDQFYASAGVSSISGSPFIKAGWKKNQLTIEIFTAYHVTLGFTPGIVFFWERKNKS